MATKRRKRLIVFVAALTGIVVAWNAIALQAEVVVLRRMIHSRKIVYVLRGARPGTCWALGDTGCTVVAHVDMAEPTPGGNFYTRDGRPIIYLSLNGVHPTGWGTFAVEAGWLSGGVWGSWSEHIVSWDLSGWHYHGSTVTASA